MDIYNRSSKAILHTRALFHDGHCDLQLPRILCLHGGGTNARIFRAQCRGISAQLKGKFRLCFAQAPLPSQAGPDVLSVYKDWGPFLSWIPSALGCPKVNSQVAISMIEDAMESAMERDNEEGATGPWVGLLGFSQGAKLCASVLLLQQIQGIYKSRFNFRFGVLLAGRAPLLALQPGIPTGGETVVGVNGEESVDKGKPIRLRLPTVHVHGMRDSGLHLHRQLLENCCEVGSTRLLEWDGDHRVPLKTKDVVALVKQIVAVASETGVQFNE